jgi:hypothetical protein
MVSPSTVSNLDKKIYAKIEAWRNRRIEGEHPYLYLDGIVMGWSAFLRHLIDRPAARRFFFPFCGFKPAMLEEGASTQLARRAPLHPRTHRTPNKAALPALPK